MNAVYADTAFFVALTNANDHRHSRAVRYAQSATSRIVTSDWVLIEFANFMTAPPLRLVYLATVAELEADNSVTISPVNDADYRLGKKFFRERPDKSWSMVDCISMCIMEQQKNHRGINQ